MPKGTSVAVPEPENSDNLPAEQSVMDFDISTMSFADLVDNASVIVDQGQLERNKENLIGVPHVITRATYYIPTMGNGYVNLQVKVADANTLEYAIRKGRIPNVNSLSDLLFQPEESITYNDGGTGVRRQVTEILHNLGVIDVGPVQDRADFDRPWTDWQSFTQSGVQNDANGEKVSVPDIRMGKGGRPLVIVAKHGLTVSIEPNYNKEVYYLS